MTSSASAFLARFTRLIRPVFRSDVRGRLLALLIIVLALKLAIVGANVLNSFVNRYFINSLLQRDLPAFVHYAVLYVAAFAGLSVAGALGIYTEEMLGLRWRGWLTRDFLARYLADRRYYRIERGRDVDNPDQRIADDIRTFTATTLSLGLIGFDAVVSLFSFITVLWTITPWLVLAAVCYAAVGSVVTVVVGGRLVALNQSQLQKEADLRFSLSRVREHAEAIALLGGEAGVQRRVRDRLGRAIDNLRHVIAVNRNLRVFVSLYGYLNPVLPVLVVAPFYMSGRLTDFGAVTQSAMAFPFVLGAFSLLVNQFGQFSTLAAVTNRLGRLGEAFLAAKPVSCVDLHLCPDTVRVRDATVLSHEGGEVLIKDLTVDVPPGGKLLVVGPRGAGKTGLFRALAGLECRGAGHVCRPADVLFLPQRPYTPPGTLRQLLTYTTGDEPVPDEQLLAALRAVEFAPLLHGRFDLDANQPWSDILSIGEQQQVAFARLLLRAPSFAFLDDALSALGEAEVQRLYRLLRNRSTGYVTFCERPLLAPHHDRVLELTGKGPWRLHALDTSPTAPGAIGA